MTFGAFLGNITTQSGLICLALTCAFSWWKGGRPEKLATMVVAVAWVGGDLLSALSGQKIPTVQLCISDLLMATGLLVVAVRYSSLWTGVAMMLEAFLFAMHALQFDDLDPAKWHGMVVYLLINNVLNYLVLAALALGTATEMFLRGRARDAEAVRAARRAQSTGPWSAV